MTRTALIALAILALVPAASAHTDHAGPRTHIVTAHDAQADDGTVAWFTIDDIDEANPTLTVEPGQLLLVHFVNAGDRDHTLALDAPIDRSVGPVTPGNESSIQFEIPENATGAISYGDPDWRHRGMHASLNVNATSPGTPAALPTSSVPVFLAAALGLAAVLDRRP